MKKNLHLSSQWMSWSKKSRDPFHTYMYGSMAGLPSHLRGRTPAWSVEIVSSVPCSTGNQTGTRDWASAWCNKACARIISLAHPCKCIWRLHDPGPPPLICTFSSRSTWPRNIDDIWGTTHISCRGIGIQREILA